MSLFLANREPGRSFGVSWTTEIEARCADFGRNEPSAGQGQQNEEILSDAKWGSRRCHPSRAHEILSFRSVRRCRQNIQGHF